MAMIELNASVLDPIEALAHGGTPATTGDRTRVLERFATWDGRIGDLGTLFALECSLADVWLFSAVEKAAAIGVDAARSGPNLARWLERMRGRKATREEPMGLHHD
jgi:glutathione S-transferase